MLIAGTAGGFDAGTQSVIDLKNGDVQSLVVQDPVRMGYLAMMSMLGCKWAICNDVAYCTRAMLDTTVSASFWTPSTRSAA